MQAKIYPFALEQRRNQKAYEFFLAFSWYYNKNAWRYATSVLVTFGDFVDFEIILRYNADVFEYGKTRILKILQEVM